MTTTTEPAKRSKSKPVTWPALLDPGTLAAYLGVSGDTLRRWRDSGRAPEPTIVEHDATGRPRLVRWSRADIDSWVAKGCPSVDTASKRGGRRGRR